MKESAIEKLLQPSSSSSKPVGSLIQDIDGSPIEPLDKPVVKEVPVSTALPSRQINDDEPSMLELMMAAQREAAQETKQKKEAEVKAKEPSFGRGLKKGFFGNSKPSTKVAAVSTKNVTSSANSSKTTTTSASPPQKTDFDDDIIDLTNVSGKKSKGPVNLNMNGNQSKNKNDSDKFVFEDVQKAMDEDQHPLLQQIKKNEWVTPDLMSIMQSNKVVSKGLKDPKCIQAMQMMQTNPKEAMARFKDDEDVSLFLREFGAVMATHFEGLAAAQGQQQQQSAPPQPPVSEVQPQKIQEVGVLQARALQKQKETEEAKKKVSTNGTTSTSDKALVKAASSTKKETEEEKVQRILQDEELRTLLMDVEFQKLLVECNDPIKFQQHMRNPETARKIKKLHESGLVQTQK